MPTPVPQAAVAAVASRLAAILTNASVDRDRRAPVILGEDTSATQRAVVVRASSIQADESVEPGYTHYTVEFEVVGYAQATTDSGAADALYALHAQVVAALAGWTPTTASLAQPAEIGAEFQVYDSDESSTPAGDFAARFSILAVTPTGNPYL